MQNNYSSLMVGMQLGNPSSNLDFFHSPARWSKLTKSSFFENDDFWFLFVERLISQPQLNKRMLIAAVFNFEDPVQNDF